MISVVAIACRNALFNLKTRNHHFAQDFHEATAQSPCVLTLQADLSVEGIRHIPKLSQVSQ